jgi:hypothetical protein
MDKNLQDVTKKIFLVLQQLFTFFQVSDAFHRNLIYIDCSLELVHTLAAKTVAL